MNDDLAPTPTIRFILRDDKRILQQWFAVDLPKYMRNGEGEWRDVPLVTE